MTKESEDIYSVKAYFMNAKAGANTVMFNQDSRVLSYPCYALAKDGSVTTIESAASAMPVAGDLSINTDSRRARKSMWTVCAPWW